MPWSISKIKFYDGRLSLPQIIWDYTYRLYLCSARLWGDFCLQVGAGGRTTETVLVKQPLSHRGSFYTTLSWNFSLKMDEILPDAFIISPCAASAPTASSHEVGFESTALLIAQQQLNDARKLFLASLPTTHDLHKRANATDGTLILIQPEGTPRKAYDPRKIPKPRIRKDKEAATYFLARLWLVKMWNGKWIKALDWEAWDKTRAKMERQFGNYRLVEQPLPSSGLKAQEHGRQEKKRKRGEKCSDAESLTKKARHGKETTDKPVEKGTAFPTLEEVQAVIPCEGIQMEHLLSNFYQPGEAWDRERFCRMLHKIGMVNHITKMFIPNDS
jgi:hypothetical protein